MVLASQCSFIHLVYRYLNVCTFRWRVPRVEVVPVGVRSKRPHHGGFWDKDRKRHRKFILDTWSAMGFTCWGHLAIGSSISSSLHSHIDISQEYWIMSSTKYYVRTAWISQIASCGVNVCSSCGKILSHVVTRPTRSTYDSHTFCERCTRLGNILTRHDTFSHAWPPKMFSTCTKLFQLTGVWVDTLKLVPSTLVER